MSAKVIMVGGAPDKTKGPQVLWVEIAGFKRYVAEKTYLHSSLKKCIVTYCIDAERAKVFPTAGMAEDFVKTIVNYCGYVYQLETCCEHGAVAADTNNRIVRSIF